MTLLGYVLAAMLFLSPLHHSMTKENPVQRLERYKEIATDIVDVVNQEQPIFTGKYAKEKTALMVVSIAMHESGFSKAVDEGKKRGTVGEVCIMQVMPNMTGTKYNYTVEYLKNRKNCIRVGIAMARDSNCPGGIWARMRQYTSGSCAKRKDKKAERIIAKSAAGEVAGYVSFMRKYPPRLFFHSTKPSK
jgi:Transglycosylase SLT domain